MTTVTLHIPVEGTFSVSTDLKNLNIDFLAKLLGIDSITRASVVHMWDAHYIRRLLRTGNLGDYGRPLFTVPGFIKRAEWASAYDATHGRAFFHLCGYAKYDELVSSAELDIRADLVYHMVSDWCNTIGTLIRNIDGRVTTGEETYKFRESPTICYDRLIEENARNIRYRFFPEAETKEVVGVGAAVPSFYIIQLTVDRYFKNIPVRYEMSTDNGITWEPYTPE